MEVEVMTYGFRPENWPAFQAELQKRGISAPDIEKVEMRPTDRDRLGRVKRRLSSIALQKPVDDGPWVRFLRALGWRRFRRPRRLLRLRPFFTNRFGRARWLRETTGMPRPPTVRRGSAES